MSAVVANFTDSEWVVLQQSNDESIERERDGGNLLSDAFDALRGLLDMQGENQGPEANSTGRLIVLGDEFTNDTVTLECDDQEVASGNPDRDFPYFSLEAAAGDYSECNITINDENGVADSASLGNMRIVSDLGGGFEESTVGTVRTDTAGGFSSEVTISENESGQYAILAIANEGQQAAVSDVFAAVDNTSSQIQEQDNNETATQTDGASAPAVGQDSTNEHITRQLQPQTTLAMLKCSWIRKSNKVRPSQFKVMALSQTLQYRY